MTKLQYLQFKSNMYKDIREDCWIEFECPSCHTILWTDSEEKYKECECGKKYHVSAILYEVKSNGE